VFLMGDGVGDSLPGHRGEPRTPAANARPAAAELRAKA
jgi:hypothetical protein